jgi:peptidoglycan biosynthesis protein MviN/MurJ (putative lipid II flippase)
MSGLVQAALNTKAPSTSIGAQIKVYAVSALLPPFGLVYLWRYYKQSDRTSHRIAAIALILTILMTVASIWITRDALIAINRMFNAALNGSID